MLKKNYIHTEVKNISGMDNQTGNEFITPDSFFDLHEIEVNFLNERRQIQEYNFYSHLSIAGFYISLVLFVWHIMN